MIFSMIPAGLLYNNGYGIANAQAESGPSARGEQND